MSQPWQLRQFDGTFSYSYDGSKTASDSFSYKVNDGTADGNTVTVSIAVNPVNHNAPVAVVDSTTVDEGGTVTLTGGALSVLANDTDADLPPDTLSAILVSDVSHGSLTLNSDGTFSYTHDGSETASDSFSYKVNDGTADGNTVTVSIAVNPVNDNAPVAVVDSTTVDEGGTVTILTGGALSVLANDTDADLPPDTLSAILVSDVSHGSLTLNSDGTFSYTHDGSETASDSFSYKVNDGTADGNTVTVSIAVNPVNDNAPVAVVDSTTVDEGGTVTILTGGALSVLANDTDADLPPDTLSAILVSDVSHGSLTLNSDGTFSYTHDGSETASDSFSYKVNDGTADGNTVTVSIAVNPVNDNAPVAVVDSTTVDQGGTTLILTGGALDARPTTRTRAATRHALGDPGERCQPWQQLLNSDGMFSYTHDGSETASDSFSYKVNDGTADDTVTVSIAVNPVNDNAPVAVVDSTTVYEGGTVTVSTGGALSVLANDARGNADLVAIRLGYVGERCQPWQPDAQFLRHVQLHDGSKIMLRERPFSHKVNDGTADGNTVTVSIAVNPVNDTPVAVVDSTTVDEGGTVTILTGWRVERAGQRHGRGPATRHALGDPASVSATPTTAARRSIPTARSATRMMVRRRRPTASATRSTTARPTATR